MNPFRVVVFVTGAFVWLAAVDAAGQDYRTIRLDSEGRTVAVPVDWSDDAPPRIQVDLAPGTTACEYQLSFDWLSEIRDPFELERGSRPSPDCHADRPSPRTIHFYPEKPSASHQMLVYNLWRVLPPSLASFDKQVLESRRLQIRAALEGAEDLTKALQKLRKDLEGATTHLETLDREVVSARNAVARLENDAKLYSASGHESAVAELKTLLAKVQSERARLDVLEAGRPTTVKEIERTKANVQELERMIVLRHGDVSELSSELEAINRRLGTGVRVATLLKVGAALPRSNYKSLYYRFTSIPTPPGPIGVSLDLMNVYPRITENDRLFAIVTNRTLAAHPYPFVLSVTKTATPPPTLAAVRPTFSIPTALSLGNFANLLKTSRERADQPGEDTAVHVDPASRQTAFRDAVLSFQEKLRGNEIPEVTIGTFAPQVTVLKTQTTESKETRELTVEHKMVDVVNAVKYPQVRALYRFNYATGVLVTRLRNPSFSRVKTASDIPDTKDIDEARYRLETHPGQQRAMAGVFFSTYFRKVDIQEPVWSKRSWRWVPAMSLGVSLTDPLDNFFIGASSEVFENIHVFGGRHYGAIDRLVDANEANRANVDRDSSAPVTRKVRTHDLAFGVNFNINIFINIFSKILQ